MSKNKSHEKHSARVGGVAAVGGGKGSSDQLNLPTQCQVGTSL